MLKVGYRKEREGKSGACLYCRCKWKKSYIQIRNNEMWNKMLQVDLTFLTINFLTFTIVELFD